VTSAELLKTSLRAVAADARHTEAALRLSDGSQLVFRHRVDERWAKSIGADPQGGADGNTGIAGQILAAMSIFRLNAKHLDIQFQDGSRWDEPV
jgi:hypothetical protein